MGGEKKRELSPGGGGGDGERDSKRRKERSDRDSDRKKRSKHSDRSSGTSRRRSRSRSRERHRRRSRSPDRHRRRSRDRDDHGRRRSRSRERERRRSDDRSSSKPNSSALATKTKADDTTPTSTSVAPALPNAASTATATATSATNSSASTTPAPSTTATAPTASAATTTTTTITLGTTPKALPSIPAKLANASQSASAISVFDLKSSVGMMQRGGTKKKGKKSKLDFAEFLSLDAELEELDNAAVAPATSDGDGGKKGMDLDSFMEDMGNLEDEEFGKAQKGDALSMATNRLLDWTEPTTTTVAASSEDADDFDPLDAFMQNVNKEVQKLERPKKDRSAAFFELDEAMSKDTATPDSDEDKAAATGAGAGAGAPQTSQPLSISFEEIQKKFMLENEGGSLDPELQVFYGVDGKPEEADSGGAPADGDVQMGDSGAAKVTEDDEDAFHEEFMQAFRKQNEEDILKEAEEARRAAEEHKAEVEAEVFEERQTDMMMRKDAGKEVKDEEFHLSNVPKRKAKKELMTVDHANTEYRPFRKDFYIQAQEVGRMTDEQVKAFRKGNDDIKVRGKEPPRPLLTFFQCGLPDKVLQVIRKNKFEKPFPVQCQCIPVLMSGRDCIGIAKTGSGKTLAFLLPMIRHVMDQPPLKTGNEGDGPIAIIMAPTRELVTQIFAEARRFCKGVNVSTACVYGGAGISEQIAELRRGAQVVCCTPGRMIDMLTSNGGRVTNLRRCTYVVLDEADRMFDLGFAPQIMLMIDNIRPDRQIAMFSATFPKQVEGLAKKVLANRPVLVEVGGRSTVSDTIEQRVEIVPDGDRFRRLLDILEEHYERTLILVFVATTDACDQIFKDLITEGFAVCTLNGGMDQEDRTDTIWDFRHGEKRVMIATSVCARGLDVPDLGLVVNYHIPNHYEDYVHRVGRTGRAGRKGIAVTFLAPEEDKYAPMMVEALTKSKTEIPSDLNILANTFHMKRKNNLITDQAAKTYSGYITGKGHKFDDKEAKAKQKARKQQMKSWGEVVSDDEEEMENAEKVEKEMKEDLKDKKLDDLQTEIDGLLAKAAEDIPAEEKESLRTKAKELQEKRTKLVQDRATKSYEAAGNAKVGSNPVAMAQAMAQQIAKSLGMSSKKDVKEAAPVERGPGGLIKNQTGHFEDEVDINDYPQNARWKVTRRSNLTEVIERYSVAITTKGVFVGPGKRVPTGERKLYLVVEGLDEYAVKQAGTELRKGLEDASGGMGPSSGKGYSLFE